MLIVDKPAGLTSYDVVARLRRLTGEKRVGHAGTLDPAATGVLPVCVGQATRLIEYLSDADKTYEGEVLLGVQTDTDDAEGAVVGTAPVPPLTRAEVEVVLDRFRGPIQQVPPAYAAIKVGGRKLYELARGGAPVAAAPRTVTIARLELLDWRPPALTLLVECSKGTYIRALARDIGTAIGCGGHLRALRRTRAGRFTLAGAHPLAELEAHLTPATWPRFGLPPDALLLDLPAVTLDEAGAGAWRHGSPVAGPAADDGAPARVYDAGGVLLGVGRYDAATGRWRPHKVLSSAGGGGL